jgi:hypothetical protein
MGLIFDTPFKKTTLRHEIKALHHLLQLNGSPGLVFIDGVHYALTGPRRGHVQVLYQNTDEYDAYGDHFASCLASHIYLYLRKSQHYLVWLSSWFELEEALHAEDTKWDPVTSAATTLCSLTNNTYD